MLPFGLFMQHRLRPIQCSLHLLYVVQDSGGSKWSLFLGGCGLGKTLIYYCISVAGDWVDRSLSCVHTPYTSGQGVVTVAWVQCPSLNMKWNTQVVCASQLVCSWNICNYNASIYMYMYPCIGNGFSIQWVCSRWKTISDLQDLVANVHSATSHNMPIDQWTTSPCIGG